MPATPSPPSPGDPFCSNCGYHLRGVTEESRCPECGRPLVEVLTRASAAASRARRYRSEAMLFGLPVVEVAFGPRPEFGESAGRARAVFAFGDTALGVVACGGRAAGLVACGGVAAGGFAIGGVSAGLLTAVGGAAIGTGLVASGAAIGTLASGGGAVGVVAQGGAAVGVYARGGAGAGVHTISPGGADPAAVAVFDALAPIMGGRSIPLVIFQPMAVAAAATLLIALAVWVVAMAGGRVKGGGRGRA